MILADKFTCTACMACVDACSQQVLRADIDINGYFAIHVNTMSSCVECGKCTRVCPVLMNKKIDRESAPYAAWNIDSEQRQLSASGGVFAAIAALVISKCGSVYGAAIEGFEVKHKRIITESDLHLLQGSKYQHSDMTGIYKQVRNDLQQGMYVLFSGLGCQVAGLLSFLDKTNKDKLYTIDTICGGLSTLLPILHLKESGKYKRIISFRDKVNGWKSSGFRYSLKLLRNDGSTEDLGLDNLVLNTFSSKLMKRSSCLDCKFTGFSRVSDCTIGDFWGDVHFREQHTRGLSVFITHDSRIMNLIHEAKMEIHRVTWKEIIASNHNIYWTHYPYIRYFISRKAALHAIQRKDYAKALQQMDSWSVAGLFLRLYLKVNMLHRKFSFFYTISIKDKKQIT